MKYIFKGEYPMSTTPVSIKFMTFNLRVDCATDGIQSFSNRFGRVVELLKKERPSVVGFQEVTDSMRVILRENLPGYTVQGCGREANYHGESMLFAYRSDEIELITLDNLWLSPTPRVPGSTYGGDQSKCPRMMTTALLKHNSVQEPFRFVNTHFDHIGQNARFLEAKQLCEYLSSCPEKFVLTGDFNAIPTSLEMEWMTKTLCLHGAIDCTQNLGGTFHNFGKIAPADMEKIDYIFTNGVCQDVYIVPDTPVNGQYYSDHHAICALISLE